MKDEIDENILIMGAFTFCPRINSSMLANDCLDCENINEKDGQYTCVYDEESDAGRMRIVELITSLLELVEEGKTHITKKELVDLLFPGDE